MNFIKPFWLRYKRRKADWWTETSIFLFVYKKFCGRSCLTGRYYDIEDLQAWQFAHILPKWMYPQLRLDPNNIIFVDDIQQHERVDRKVRKIWKLDFFNFVKKWIAVQKLKEERNLEHNLY